MKRSRPRDIIFRIYAGDILGFISENGGKGYTMIRDIITANEDILPGGGEIAALKEHFPACFHSDGSFDLECFKEYPSDKVTVVNEGYEPRFLGKNYARRVKRIYIDPPYNTGSGGLSIVIIFIIPQKNCLKN